MKEQWKVLARAAVAKYPRFVQRWLGDHGEAGAGGGSPAPRPTAQGGGYRMCPVKADMNDGPVKA